MNTQGITELFLESAEPSFDEQPLDEFLALFPEGVYRFRGRTTDGRPLKAKAFLTHALPDVPLLIFPDDEKVDPEEAEFSWMLVPDPAGSEIIGYHIVVECEECKWEVLAIEESGNRTISEAEIEIEIE